MSKPLVLPPGHKIVITVDADTAPFGVTVVAYRGDHWLGEVSIDTIYDDGALQRAIDMLTKRGPRGVKET